MPRGDATVKRTKLETRVLAAGLEGERPPRLTAPPFHAGTSGREPGGSGFRFPGTTDVAAPSLGNAVS